MKTHAARFFAIVCLLASLVASFQGVWRAALTLVVIGLLASGIASLLSQATASAFHRRFPDMWGKILLSAEYHPENRKAPLRYIFF